MTGRRWPATEVDPPWSASQVAELAQQHGLERVDTPPGLVRYLHQLWERRAFVVELATARAYERNQNNVLGQLWAALNPLLLAGSYFLIFGLLLDTSRGVDNYPAFLSVGIFIFSFIAASATIGAKSVTSNLSLVRSVRFPRAALPVSVVLAEFLLLLPAIGVLLVLLPIVGEPPRWEWLLLPGAMVLLFGFCAGLAMICARLVLDVRDALNLIPVTVRLLRYVSGVFFSIAAYAGHGSLSLVMQYQPVALFLQLVRSCLLAEVPQDPLLWVWGGIWAVGFLVVGIVVFWRAEGRYGRD